MLDSMLHNPRPTRAEATDIANAIFDGTDAVMLSGETAVGRFPVKCISTMDSIIREAEANFNIWGHQVKIVDPTGDDTVSISHAVREMAHDRNVACIAVFTLSGRTALLVSKTRPCVPILAFTPDRHTHQLMGMYWGVIPILAEPADTVENMLSCVEEGIATSTSIEPGQQVVLVAGYPVGAFSPANLILLHTVKKP